MKYAALLLPMLLISSNSLAQPPQSPQAAAVQARAATPVTLAAKDGVKLFARYYEAPNPKAIILLFHQAGSNKAEYATIAPRLVAAGYSALALDQRSGGRRFGAANETVGAAKRNYTYLEAKPDLEAALAWAQEKRLPIVIWGSSYSAALVYVVAAENQDKVSAALAFSGGDFLGGGRVSKAAKAITIPFFATSARSEAPSMQPILARAPSKQKIFFVPKTEGVHGSSTLITAENPQGAEQTWAAVLSFLQTALAK